MAVTHSEVALHMLLLREAPEDLAYAVVRIHRILLIIQPERGEILEGVDVILQLGVLHSILLIQMLQDEVALLGIRPAWAISEQVIHINKVRKYVIVAIVRHLKDVLHVVIRLKVHSKAKTFQDQLHDLRR